MEKTPPAHKFGAVPGDIPSTRLRCTLLALSLLMGAVILNVTSLSSALPTIARELGISAIQTFWVGTSSLITSTAFQPIFGSLSAIFGRRPLMLMAIASFTTGTIVASQAHGAATLLLGRCIQGLGAGGITTLSEVLLTDLVPLRLRGRYLAYLNSVWAIGSTTGPVLGAAFAQKATWRWSFYVNIPLVAVGFILMISFTEFRPVPASIQRKLTDVDWAGILLFTASCTSILIPLTWGGIMYPWGSWQTLTPLLIGSGTLLLFIGYEAHFATNPVILPALFRSRTLAVGFIGTTTHGLIISCGLYYLPIYFQAVKGYSPILSGVALFPVTFTLIPGAIATGALISWTCRYRPIIWVGWLFTILGLGFVCMVRIGSSNVVWVICLVAIGLGLGMLFSALNIAVLAAVAPLPKQVAAAATMFTFFRALGQTLGVAIGGTIFSNRIRANLIGQPFMEALSHGGTSQGSGVDPLASVHLINQIEDVATRQQVRIAYLDALRVVWAFCCALAGVAGLLSICMQHHQLSSKTAGR